MAAFIVGTALRIALPHAGAQAPQVAPADAQVQPGPAPVQPADPRLVAPMLAPVPSALPSLDPRIVAVRYELVQIELELARLRARRPRLFWPVALVSVGGGTAALAGMIGLTVWATARDRRYGWDEQGNRYEHTAIQEQDRDAARVAAGYAVLGLALAAGGLALLIPRVRMRRRLSAEVQQLSIRREQLFREARYSLQIDPRQLGVSAGVRF